MSARAPVLMTVAGSAERIDLLPPEQRAPRRACSGRTTRRSNGVEAGGDQGGHIDCNSFACVCGAGVGFGEGVNRSLSSIR